MRRAVYAGSFDPVTNGHLWVLREGSRLFDHLIVAIGHNPDKKGEFLLEDRLAMLRESVPEDCDNVTIGEFEEMYLIHYAQKMNANYLLRGVRNESDYRYERSIQWMNLRLDPDIKTIFVFPPDDVSYISSSLVKGLIGPQGWEEVVRPLVPDSVYQHFLTARRAHA